MSGINVQDKSTAQLKAYLEALENADWHRSASTYGGWDNTQIQHVIPKAQAVAFEDVFRDVNSFSDGKFTFDLNGADNLVVLPTSLQAQFDAMKNGNFAAVHHGWEKQHVFYSQYFQRQFKNFQDECNDALCNW